MPELLISLFFFFKHNQIMQKIKLIWKKPQLICLRLANEKEMMQYSLHVIITTSTNWAQ